jgi:hypothetical protein
MAQKTRRVLRLNRVNGNGTAVGTDVPFTLRDAATGEPLEGVVVTLRMLSEDERKAIVASHTRLEKDPAGGRGLFEFIDLRAANDEIFCKTIVDWTGIAGADDRPLVCTDQTKLLLDVVYRGQIQKKAFGAEVVEVLAASFR